jgi:DNA-binding beta-propeller fold protein YncE
VVISPRGRRTPRSPDLQTLKPIGEFKVGKKPDAIVYEPLTKRIYVMNGESNDITVLNAVDGSLAGTVDLGADRNSRFPTARASFT